MPNKKKYMKLGSKLQDNLCRKLNVLPKININSLNI